MTLSIAATLPMLVIGPPNRPPRPMSAATLAGLTGAALVGLGLYGLLVAPAPAAQDPRLQHPGQRRLPAVRHHRAQGRGRRLRRRSRAAGDGHHRHRRRLLGHGARGRLAAAALPGNRPRHARSRCPGEGTRRRSRCLMLAMALALATTAGGFLLVLADHRARHRHAAVAGARRASCRTHRARPDARRARPVARHRGRDLATRASRWSTSWADGRRRSASRLRADGFSAVMLVTAALVITAAGYFARANFATPPELAEKRAPLAFWTLLQGLWAALNVVFLGGDLFNLYRRAGAADLRRRAAGLPRRPSGDADGGAALPAVRAVRFGALSARHGAALRLLRHARHRPAGLPQRRSVVAPAVCVAAALMTAGLLAKAALFPLHLWLPPAHANAPAAASAVLSALVVKGVVLPDRSAVVRRHAGARRARRRRRCSADARRRRPSCSAACWRLRQARLKLLIAYSTVAQIGYLFLMFPLVAGDASVERRGVERRRDADPVACLRQGGDVPGGGPGRRAARP